MAHFNDQLGMGGSYYAATAQRPPATEPLHGDVRADVVVIGAGCTGLAAARTAALQGRRVLVIEGGEIGWGASGRNGGQMIPGLRQGAAQLIERYGREHARRVFDLADSACDEVAGLIAAEGIACDLKQTGHLTAALRQNDLEDMKREYDCLTDAMNYPHVALLDAAEVETEVAHSYVGGLLHTKGGHLHPLNYTLGLARAAMRAGAQIHTHSPVRKLERTGSGVEVRTAQGVVQAEACVLAGDALLGALDRRLETHIMPIANYIAATAPLKNAAELIKRDRAISDSRFVVNYYRLSADGRLIFGGGERYTTSPPADMAGFVRPFLERTFPQLAGVAIDYAWGGMVSVTRNRLPHVGRDGPLYWAHGYSGMGVVLSTLAGRVLAEALNGSEARADLLASLAPPPFPGGPALRGPLHILAMLWFSLRDRLGV